MEVYGNICDVTGLGLVFQHKGGRNVIRNNISAQSKYVHVRCQHDFDYAAETVVELNAGDRAGDRMYEISGGDPAIRDNCSLSTGMWPSDIQADPKIVRDSSGRITGLAPDSPLIARGFRRIPVEKIGLVGSPHGWAGSTDEPPPSIRGSAPVPLSGAVKVANVTSTPNAGDPLRIRWQHGKLSFAANSFDGRTHIADLLRAAARKAGWSIEPADWAHDFPHARGGGVALKGKWMDSANAPVRREDFDVGADGHATAILWWNGHGWTVKTRFQ